MKSFCRKLNFKMFNPGYLASMAWKNDRPPLVQLPSPWGFQATSSHPHRFVLTATMEELEEGDTKLLLQHNGKSSTTRILRAPEGYLSSGDSYIKHTDAIQGYPYRFGGGGGFARDSRHNSKDLYSWWFKGRMLYFTAFYWCFLMNKVSA